LHPLHDSGDIDTGAGKGKTHANNDSNNGGSTQALPLPPFQLKPSAYQLKARAATGICAPSLRAGGGGGAATTTGAVEICSTLGKERGLMWVCSRLGIDEEQVGCGGGVW
jgi:hypothetical protein